MRCSGRKSAKSPWPNWMSGARTAKSRNWRSRRAAAADLAKATEEVKAATSDKDKEAAAQHLAEAQKNLAQTVKTASKETAKEEKKAEATTAAMAKQAEAAPPPAATVDSGIPAAGVKVVPAAASDKEVLQKAAEIRGEEIRRHGRRRKG